MARYRRSDGPASGRPQPVADIWAELVARRGYGRLRENEALTDAWRESAGPLIAGATRLGAVKRGTLEVFVANAAVLQELTFMQAELLAKLLERLPASGIKKFKFRVTALPQ